MALEILLVAVLPALLVATAVWDLTSFTIPNTFTLTLLALFVVFAGSLALSGSGMDWERAGFHVLAGAVALAAGMALFAKGWIGGGDAKLFAVASLWLGWNALFEYTLIASALGGVLTLGLIVLRRLALPPSLLRHEWLARLCDRSAGIPYGVALAAGALIVLPRTDLFRLAAAG
jgi:prepilin peptidase CpaA